MVEQTIYYCNECGKKIEDWGDDLRRIVMVSPAGSGAMDARLEIQLCRIDFAAMCRRYKIKFFSYGHPDYGIEEEKEEQEE